MQKEGLCCKKKQLRENHMQNTERTIVCIEYWKLRFKSRRVGESLRLQSQQLWLKGFLLETVILICQSNEFVLIEVWIQVCAGNIVYCYTSTMCLLQMELMGHYACLRLSITDAETVGKVLGRTLSCELHKWQRMLKSKRPISCNSLD